MYQCSEHADPNTLPASQASPEDVRQFIISVLVSRRQLPIDYARYVAARWHIGSGLELRTYPASMYSELFGSEDGWIIYKEIKPMIDGESQKKAIDHHGPRMLYSFFYHSRKIKAIDTPGSYRPEHVGAICLLHPVDRIHQFEEERRFVRLDGLSWHIRIFARHVHNGKFDDLCKEFRRKGHWRASRGCRKSKSPPQLRSDLRWSSNMYYD